MSHVTRTPLSRSKGQLVADVLNSQHAGTGATWRINTKICQLAVGGSGISWWPPAYSLLMINFNANSCRRLMSINDAYFIVFTSLVNSTTNHRSSPINCTYTPPTNRPYLSKKRVCR